MNEGAKMRTEQPEQPDWIDRGQPYWLVDQVEHRTMDGRDIVLDVWTGFCAKCGEPFEFKKPKDQRKDPCRRCPDHKRPGKSAYGRVKKQAGERVEERAA